MISLSRAFLHAGAAATVATLWNVSDWVGPAFAARLYDGLLDGDSLGTALTSAKRALRDAGAPPRDWAAYVLAGPPAGRVALTRGARGGRMG